MNNDIKYKLANAMKECMFSSPVEKITVKEICDTCGVTRQTFYRNFQDKYDQNLNISGWSNFSLRLLLKMMSRTI